jgi:hypothetical protein
LERSFDASMENLRKARASERYHPPRRAICDLLRKVKVLPPRKSLKEPAGGLYLSAAGDSVEKRTEFCWIFWVFRWIGSTMSKGRSTCKFLAAISYFVSASIMATRVQARQRFVPITNIEAYHAELGAKKYRYTNPGIERMPWGRTLEVIDPFSNRLRFCERP